MARHLEDGAWAERHARRHLERKGLKLVEKNFSTRFGEIDLVMRDKETLVFVEVRLRRNTRFGHPAESIDRGKIERLRRTAESYLSAHGEATACRFDVVAITGNRNVQTTEWIPDAFC
jgi:putative endonuclease